MDESLVEEFSLVLRVAGEIGTLLLISFLISFALRKTLSALIHKRGLRESIKTICESLYTPSIWLIWGYAVILSLRVISENTSNLLEGVDMGQVRAIYFTLGFIWIASIWKDKAFYHWIPLSDNPPLGKILRRASSVLLWVIGLLVLLDILNLPIAGLLAFGGVGGIAISLAAGDVVKNFFGGLMIHMQRHFVEGDWIRSPNKEFEGYVEEVGWYMTKLRTLDRRPLYVPNTLLTEAIIENPGQMYNYQIKKVVGIRYDDLHVVRPLLQSIEAMLHEHPAIDHEQQISVNVIEFSSSSVDIEVYAFTKVTKTELWKKEQQDILLQVAELVKKQGAEMAYPTTTIHVRQL